MALSNADLLSRFEREHFDRQSITAGRRVRSRTVLARLADQIAPRTLAELTAADFMAWQGAERARGAKTTTIRNYETMVRAFVTWAATTQVISFESAAQLKSIPGVRGGRSNEPKPYKRAEVERLRELLEQRFPLAPERGPGSRMIRRYLRGESRLVKAVYLHARRLQYEAQISLALEEGLRAIELHRIGLPELAPDNEGVVVFTAKGEPGSERVREVPFTNHSRQVVAEWLDFRSLMAPAHESPWLTLVAARPTDAQSFRQFEKALHVFGRPYYRWHRLRHTFATERLRAGLPLEKLQRMMGHANLAQTLAYAEIVNADLHTEAARTADDFARNLGLAA